MPFQPGNKFGGRSKANHTIKAEKLREWFTNKVAEEAPSIYQPLIESARGLFYEVVKENGIKIVYQEKPDVNAAKYLLDQTIGKPRETIDIGAKIEMLDNIK